MERYQESLSIHHRLRIRQGLAPCLEGTAQLLLAQGQAVLAVRLLGAAAGLREELETPPPPIERAPAEWFLAQLQRALGDPRFDAAWTAGQARPLDGLIAETLQAVEGQAEQEGSLERQQHRTV